MLIGFSIFFSSHHCGYHDHLSTAHIDLICILGHAYISLWCGRGLICKLGWYCQAVTLPHFTNPCVCTRTTSLLLLTCNVCSNGLDHVCVMDVMWPKNEFWLIYTGKLCGWRGAAGAGSHINPDQSAVLTGWVAAAGAQSGAGGACGRLPSVLLTRHSHLPQRPSPRYATAQLPRGVQVSHSSYWLLLHTLLVWKTWECQGIWWLSEKSQRIGQKSGLLSCSLNLEGVHAMNKDTVDVNTIH